MLMLYSHAAKLSPELSNIKKAASPSSDPSCQTLNSLTKPFKLYGTAEM